MAPTVKVGDYLVLNKVAYSTQAPWFNIRVGSFDTPRRGDVVVFEYPSDREIIYLQRVICIPGDTIVYTSTKQLYINDELIVDTANGEARDGLIQGRVLQERIGDITFLIQQMDNLSTRRPTKSWIVSAATTS